MRDIETIHMMEQIVDMVRTLVIITTPEARALKLNVGPDRATQWDLVRMHNEMEDAIRRLDKL